MSATGIVGGMLGLYKIVPANEAHIRIMGNKKEVFNSREAGKDGQFKSAYWQIPFITKVHKLPLTNLRIDVPDIKLNDENMARFMCDIVCFVNVEDPMKAAERTQITTASIGYEMDIGVKKMAEDLRAIMEGVGRTVATKQTIIDIYKDRSKLDSAVSAELEKVLKEWGFKLVDLEIKDLKDAPESTIISDIEAKISAQISADARVKKAQEEQRAILAEADAQKISETRKAEAEEAYRKRQIEKDRQISISQAEADMKTAEQRKLANTKKVEADRVFTVGQADILREKAQKDSEAQRIQLAVVAEGEAEKVKRVGQAEADIIKAKKVAEAEGISKLADAQKKFDEKATNITAIQAIKDVELARAEAYGKALANANISIVGNSSADLVDGGIVGNVKLGGKEGVAINQFLKGIGIKDPSQLGSLLDLFSKAQGKTTKDSKPGGG